jgi:hypothetical protein
VVAGYLARKFLITNTTNDKGILQNATSGMTGDIDAAQTLP